MLKQFQIFSINNSVFLTTAFHTHTLSNSFTNSWGNQNPQLAKKQSGTYPQLSAREGVNGIEKLQCSAEALFLGGFNPHRAPSSAPLVSSSVSVRLQVLPCEKTGLCLSAVRCIISHSVSGSLGKPVASLRPAERFITVIDGSLLLRDPIW